MAWQPNPRRATPPPPQEVPATPGTIAEHRASGVSGEVVRVESGAVVLRDWRGRERAFPLRPAAFLVDDRPTTLVSPARATARRDADHREDRDATQRWSASGARTPVRAAAKVASPHRILVEGTHDAELLERVWGDELREAAVVVEPLGGADHLAAAVRAFGPGRDRRLGVLLDHLVPGTKEHRLAQEVRQPWVLVTGHPFVDVWQGVRPHVAGLSAWPEVPKGQDWKAGICAALGEPEPALLWRRLLRSVRTYADLERDLVGAVERLLDFLIEPSAPDEPDGA